MMKEDRYILGGKYQLLEVLGEGGMSTVYKAKHLRLDVVRAIKEVRTAGFENCLISRKRLMQEAELLKDMHHSGIPEVMDIMEENGNVYIVMEYIQGENLQTLLGRRKCFSEKEVIQTGKMLCEILIYLHDRSILYLDMKPSNIIRKPTGELVLIDFGTAFKRPKERVLFTMQMGTRGYAAPEQYILDSPLDERTDVFSLGMTLACLLTGYGPGGDLRVKDLLALCRKDVSQELKEVLAKATAPDPSDRYLNCYEMLYGLETVYQNRNEKILESKRKLLVFLFMLGAIFCSAGVIFTIRIHHRQLKNELARTYITRASHAQTIKGAAADFMCALKLLPDEEKIYEEIIHYYMDLNTFTEQNSVILINLLTTDTEKGPAMDCLSKEEYARICYRIGTGYFFQLGGKTGKKESVRWFREVENAKYRQMDQEMKRHAALYRKAAVYYIKYTEENTISTGKKDINYRNLLKTVIQMNQCDFPEHPGSEEVKGIYMISTEVVL